MAWDREGGLTLIVSMSILLLLLLQMTPPPSLATMLGDPRRLLSVGIAIGLFIAITLAGFRYRDEIRFAIVKPIHLHELHRLAPTASGRIRKSWDWRGGMGWNVELVYDDAPQRKVEDRPGRDGCTRDFRALGSHFFLEGEYC
ncbi:hypothetical protein SAMN05216548_104217 [Faunimonas pinastri]|uniref:Uncharacterized protein n=2 Tax=Faunimonas pinastri TaxID=1855383 RepID=A0A1H9FVR0_9HYPH|nr:hypothetical protein SAMN05216548_104217 [Faunimonas pinastri]